MKRNWRTYVIYLTFLGMEICWLYALLTLLNIKTAHGSLSVWGLLPVLPLAFIIALLLKRLTLRKFFLSAISWILWAIALLLIVKFQLYSDAAIGDSTWLIAVPQAFLQILFGFKPELLILIMSAVMWWLGQRLAHVEADFPAAVTDFQLGLALLLMVFFFNFGFGLEQNHAVFTAMIFFFFALAGISLAHGKEGGGWLHGFNQGNWMAMLLITIGLILMVGLLIGFMVTPDFINLILMVIGWLWDLLMRILIFIASLFPPPDGAEPLPPMQPATPGGDQEDMSKWLQMPEILRSALQLVWGAMIIIIFALAVYRVSSQIFAWLRRRMASQGGEVEQLEGAFKADILGWLKRLIFRILRIRLPGRSPKAEKAVAPEAASVRQIYSQLLQWAAAGGYPRRMFQTPFEYLGVLKNLLPTNEQDLDVITREYMNVRYGNSVPTEDIISKLKQRWHNIKQSSKLKSQNSKLS